MDIQSESKRVAIDLAINALSGMWPSDDLSAIYLHHGLPGVGYIASRWSVVRKFLPVCTYTEYEARKAERQKKPSWKGAPQWANWIAQDECGRWFWFTHKPEVNGLEFVEPSDDGKVFLATTGGEVIGDWRETLEQRPTNSTCVADGLREIREAFADWGVSIAGAQVAHKGTTPNGMHKLEVTFDENHIVESDEKAVQELKFAEIIKGIYPGRAAAIYCKHIQSAIDKAEIEKAVKACERALDEFFPKAKLPDWYDYENKKAVQLPPVGIECELRLGTTWNKTHVVAHHIDGVRAIHCMDGFSTGELGYSSVVAFRPLDWDRLSPKPEPESSPELSFHLSNAFNELQASARLLPDDDARKPMLVSLANGVSVVREGV